MLAKPQMWWPGINRQHPLAVRQAFALPLWEGGGGIVRDVVVARAGACSSTTWVGGALEFLAASSAYVDFGTTEIISAAPFTLLMGLQLITSPNYRRVFLQGTNASSYRIMVAQGTAGLELELNCYVSANTSSAPIAACAPLTLGQWHVFAWTRDTANNDVTYLDGVPASGTPNAVVAGHGGNLYLGRRDSGNYFDGRMSVVGAWPYVFSPGAVAALSADVWAALRPSSVARLHVAVAPPAGIAVLRRRRECA